MSTFTREERAQLIADGKMSPYDYVSLDTILMALQICEARGDAKMCATLIPLRDEKRAKKAEKGTRSSKMIRHPLIQKNGRRWRTMRIIIVTSITPNRLFT